MSELQNEASGELVLVKTSELAAVIAGMAEVEPTTATAQETRYRMVTEMLAAETEEDLWTELPTWSSKDNIGKTFRIDDVRGVFRSRFDGDGATGFIACSAVDVLGDANAKVGDDEKRATAAGEAGVFSTSAVRLAARIGWYEQHNAFPVTLRVVKRSETPEGYPILDAVKVDA